MPDAASPEDADTRASSSSDRVNVDSFSQVNRAEIDATSESVARRLNVDPVADVKSAQLHLDSAEPAPPVQHATVTPRRHAENEIEAAATSREQAVEVDVKAQPQPAQLSSTSQGLRESELHVLALSDSIEQEKSATRDVDEPRKLPQGRWRAAEGEPFTFDARRQKTRDAEGADVDTSIKHRRSITPNERFVHANATAEPRATPTIIMPRSASHIESDIARAQTRHDPSVNSMGDEQPSTLIPSHPQSALSPVVNVSTRGDADTLGVERRVEAETDHSQARVGEHATPEWARRLARELSASTQPRTTPASEPRALNASPTSLEVSARANGQARADAPKLTIHRLDVQIVNQPPAPTVQFFPPPVESESPSAGVDLDRHYLGRSSFII
jgi:hypothetical protein